MLVVVIVRNLLAQQCPIVRVGLISHLLCSRLRSFRRRSGSGGERCRLAKGHAIDWVDDVGWEDRPRPGRRAGGLRCYGFIGVLT